MPRFSPVCDRIRRYKRFLRLLAAVHGERSAVTLVRLWLARNSDRSTLREGTVRLRSLGGREVSCRSGTTDLEVLYDTFCAGYHLPPRDLGPIKSVLDLGSNVGYTIAHLAVLNPAATIVGVELDRANWELCRRNIAGFGERCSVLRGAVWDKDGEIHYNRAASPQSHRVREGVRGAETAPAHSLESLLGHLPNQTADYVKMDIEGAEEVVFQRTGEWVKRVRCLKVEIHRPYTVEACLRDLGQLGFECQIDRKHPTCVVARAG